MRKLLNTKPKELLKIKVKNGNAEIKINGLKNTQIIVYLHEIAIRMCKKGYFDADLLHVLGCSLLHKAKEMKNDGNSKEESK